MPNRHELSLLMFAIQQLRHAIFQFQLHRCNVLAILRDGDTRNISVNAQIACLIAIDQDDVRGVCDKQNLGRRFCLYLRCNHPNSTIRDVMRDSFWMRGKTQNVFW